LAVAENSLGDDPGCLGVLSCNHDAKRIAKRLGTEFVWCEPFEISTQKTQKDVQQTPENHPFAASKVV
jgi:hypothetical protein